MVKNKAVYIALVVTREGEREFLGFWIADNEGAKFCLSVMNELRNRGVQDNATLTFGTTFFGADKDAQGIGSDIPRAQFVKINAGWQRQGALGNAGTLVTDLRAQWSPHTLYGSEQLSLGSYSTVRGYEASVATGDMGVYMRNDLYLTPNIWNFLPEETAAKVANKTQTHLFLDMGITRDHARGVTEKAAGFGLGLSYYHKRFTLSGTVGVPLIEDNRFGLDDPVFQVRMDVKTW